MLKIKKVVAKYECQKCEKCPTVLALEDGSVLVQGYKLNAEDTSFLDIPEGENVVHLPKDFIQQVKDGFKNLV